MKPLAAMADGGGLGWREKSLDGLQMSFQMARMMMLPMRWENYRLMREQRRKNRIVGEVKNGKWGQ